jgi:hypothetical protein
MALQKEMAPQKATKKAHGDVQEVRKTAGPLLVATALECNVMNKIAPGRAVGKAVYKNFRLMAGPARD